MWQCAAVALLFGVHPLRVESVAWVAERKDVLSGLFFLLTLLAYVRYVAQPSNGRYLLTLALFALGLMSKPMLVTMPFVLLLLDWWPLERWFVRVRGVEQSRAKQLVWEKVPFFTLSAMSAVITIYAQSIGGAVKPLDQAGMADRVANAIVAYATYVWLMIWPVGLSCIYPFPGMNLWHNSEYFPKLLASMFALCVISLVVIWQRHIRKYLALGWMWYLGMLVPVIGVLAVGMQAYADRYTYLPTIGILIAVVWYIGEWIVDHPRRQIAGVVALVAILSTWMVLTWRQVEVWSSSRALFAHAIRVTPESGLAWSSLGLELAESGELEEALYYCERGVEVYSDEFTVMTLGTVLTKLGRLEEAAKMLEIVVARAPHNYGVHGQLAMVLKGLGQRDKALYHIEQAVILRPDVLEYRLFEADLLGTMKHYGFAQQKFEAIKERWPREAKGYVGAGSILVVQGNLPAAAEQFRRATELEPDVLTYRRLLIQTYLNLNEFEHAEAEANRYIEQAPQAFQGHLLLGLALDAQGKLQQALEEYRRALELNPDAHEAANNLAWALATHQDDAVRDGAEAVRLATRVCEATSYKKADALDTLAVALAETGEFDRAIETIEQAMALVADDEQADVELTELNERKALFEAGQPFRAP